VIDRLKKQYSNKFDYYDGRLEGGATIGTTALVY
jgi:hypothetical protein